VLPADANFLNRTNAEAAMLPAAKKRKINGNVKASAPSFTETLQKLKDEADAAGSEQWHYCRTDATWRFMLTCAIAWQIHSRSGEDQR
jgi:hypothetical protein